MPGFDGGEVARQVWAEAALRKVEIVFFTSLLSQEETKKELISRGGKNFLAKPVDSLVLIRCIETSLSHIPAQAQ
jgi:CheY-like chemotaxis protein